MNTVDFVENKAVPDKFIAGDLFVVDKELCVLTRITIGTKYYFGLVCVNDGQSYKWREHMSDFVTDSFLRETVGNPYIYLGPCHLTVKRK